MPRFAANLSFFYNELPFLDRFAAAARDGFEGVEYLFPYAWPASELSQALRAGGLQQVLFNAPCAGADLPSSQAAWDAGERGTASVPGREAEFRAGIELALNYAQVLQCTQIHVMAGRTVPGCSTAQQNATYVENLRWAAQTAERVGVGLLIEPINTRDMPDYFLHHQQQAHDIVGQVGCANLKVQMDLYHCQIMEGDLATRLTQYLPAGKVGHLQIAGVPTRNEPDMGEVNYAYLFERIDALGYAGWVGCEYRPRRGACTNGTTDGLSWLRALR